MRRTGFAIFLTLAMTLSPAQLCVARDLLKSFEVETQVFNLVSQAESALGRNDYGTARDLLMRAAQQDPTSYSKNVHRDLARVYKATKQYEMAIREARKVLNLDPRDDAASYDLANIYYEQGKYDEAIEAAKRILATSSDQAYRQLARDFIKNAGSYGYLSKGQQALNAQKWSDAKRWFQKASQYDPSPNSEYIHSGLCYALWQLGESAAAVEEGRRALAIDPRDASTMYTMAMACADDCRFDEAISWMNKYAANENDSGRRQRAAASLALIQNDRSQYLDPNNKLADYFAVMRTSDDEIIRWPKEKLPLKVMIKSPNNVRGYKPAFNNLVKVALDGWCQASGKKLDYKLVSDSGDADIVVSWTKDPLEVSMDHENTQPCGLTHLHDDGSHNAISALVQVRTVDPFHPDESVTDSECAHIVLHEIGHALGIGHSKYIRDVMYFRAAPQQQILTGRDKATIAHLYSSYPMIGFVPKHDEGAAPTVPIAPPAFLPPSAPDDSKIVPPMFVPPPVDDDKLTPPMFTPPAADQGSKPAVAAPMFVPPPVGGTTPKPAAKKPATGAAKPTKPPSAQKPSAAPFFVPPPAN